MKIYVNEMPRSCAECDRFCLDENGRFGCILNSMPDYRSQEEKETARRNDCPLNSIQTLLAEKEKEQNQIAIGQLDKVRETINDKYQYLSKLEQQGELTYYGEGAKSLCYLLLKQIEQQINELKERCKNA